MDYGDEVIVIYRQDSGIYIKIIRGIVSGGANKTYLKFEIWKLKIKSK